MEQRDDFVYIEEEIEIDETPTQHMRENEYELRRRVNMIDPNGSYVISSGPLNDD